jgi:hypothetical protein
LSQFGELAEGAVRKALATKASPEAHRRLKKLLDAIEGRRLTSRQLQDLRAVEVLEHIATSEARRLLAKLADGAQAAYLTREAKSALDRLWVGAHRN